MSTVLIVDDEKNIVQLTRMYLTKEGYTVEVAYD
ncbi:MAG: DNA-binding response regulator, partial [Chloroflexi bacterium]|nr:DNA-binding response regulator [Chloroflexota bacterium]